MESLDQNFVPMSDYLKDLWAKPVAILFKFANYELAGLFFLVYLIRYVLFLQRV